MNYDNYVHIFAVVTFVVTAWFGCKLFPSEK
jgi:hypothetical protein